MDHDFNHNQVKIKQIQSVYADFLYFLIINLNCVSKLDFMILIINGDVS